MSKIILKQQIIEYSISELKFIMFECTPGVFLESVYLKCIYQIMHLDYAQF